MAHPGNPPAPLVLLGANGQLGRALLRALGERPVRAVVRSERAASTLAEIPEATRLEIHVLDPRDESALARLGAGASHWVNLVGILKETRRARYHDAHEALSLAVARAATRAGARRIVALSILGAAPASKNACLASRGRADEILLRGEVPATVLRLPMVLAPGERATRALAQRAAARVAWLTRGGAAREQPLDVRDAVAAMLRALQERSEQSFALDLAGPVSLSRAELLARIAQLSRARRAPRVLPLPFFAVAGFAALCERLLPNPPLSRAMLGVLERDDCVDPAPAALRLGLELTPLQQTLAHNFTKSAP